MTSHAIWVDEIRGVTGMKWQASATLLKKRHKHRCFPVNIVKLLRTVFFYGTPPVLACETWHVNIVSQSKNTKAIHSELPTDESHAYISWLFFWKILLSNCYYQTSIKNLNSIKYISLNIFILHQ